MRALGSSGGSAGRGIGKYITDLVEGLAGFGTGHEVVLFVRAGTSLPERLESLGLAQVPVAPPTWDESNRSPFFRLPKVRSYQPLLIRVHDRAVAAQREAMESAVAASGVDVLHLPTALDIGSFPEGSFGVPTVMTFLDAIPLVLREEAYDRWPLYVQRFYDRQLANLRTAARVVAISEASRQDALRYAALASEKVVVVYPAVADEFGQPVSKAVREEVRARYGIERPYFLFCSVPDPHKNPHRVIRAFARARASLTSAYDLVFVSPHGAPYEEGLHQTAQEAGVADAFRITGRVPDVDLAALFQGAMALVSPSLIEGFGLPAAQAMRAGVPSIVSDHGAQAEVVGDAGLRVPPEDEETLAVAIATLGEDASLRQKLSEQGKERANRFRPEVQAQSLLRIYHEVAGTQG